MKTIKSLIQKLENNPGGTINGGFGLVKGGVSYLKFSTNTNSCDNSTSCSGTNSGSIITGCSNSLACVGTTNDQYCSNTGSCPT